MTRPIPEHALLPCPLCGGKPTIHVGAAGDTLVTCKQTEHRGTIAANGHDVSVAARKMDIAITRWNRRAEPAPSRTDGEK